MLRERMVLSSLFSTKQERISGKDLEAFLARTKALNIKYNSHIVTEFAFNGFGILEQVTTHTHAPLRPIERYIIWC